MVSQASHQSAPKSHPVAITITAGIGPQQKKSLPPNYLKSRVVGG
jgi:hypothetical protein